MHWYALLACAVVVWLFRQPTRHGTGVVSSVDGRIKSIRCVGDKNHTTITPSPFDTVGLRAPIAGVVKKTMHNSNQITITINNGSFESTCIYKPSKIRYTNIYVARGSTVKRSDIVGCMLFCKSCEMHTPSTLSLSKDPGATVYGGTSSLCT